MNNNGTQKINTTMFSDRLRSNIKSTIKSEMSLSRDEEEFDYHLSSTMKP
jgi:hypothetical protein